MLDTEPLLASTDFPRIYREELTTLQVNLGYVCNQTCSHCHVNAGPNRTEIASRETVETIIDFLRKSSIRVLDLTGGAPELNPHFRYLVSAARAMDIEVIDRCNLTILSEPGQEDLADFLADHRVRVTASLPCYSEENVNQQRGKGVFDLSIQGLQRLNQLGYGKHPDLILDLVYNPNGLFLPPSQESLEQSYKRELGEQFCIVFHRLLTITNMPISRFGGMLLAKNKYHEYINLLKNSYAEQNLAAVMCKTLISVDWQGYLYDCDFNQMLGWSMSVPRSCSSHSCSELIQTDKKRSHLSEIIPEQVVGKEILVGEHCYGCTAGQGSSCGGALQS